MDGGKVTTDQLVCLSPNGCCVAVGVRESIHFFNTGYLLTNSEWGNDHNCGQVMMMIIKWAGLQYDLVVASMHIIKAVT